MINTHENNEQYIYQVWALGYDSENQCTDGEEFLGEFTDKAEAIAQAEKFKDLSYLYGEEVLEELDDGVYFEVRVEVLEHLTEEELVDLNPEDERWKVTDFCWTNKIYKPEA